MNIKCNIHTCAINIRSSYLVPTNRLKSPYKTQKFLEHVLRYVRKDPLPHQQRSTSIHHPPESDMAPT